MNLHHFFSGKLSREEVASAFLATLLEQDQEFREFFLRDVLEIDARQCSAIWQVKVEDKNVDVCLDSPSTFVLIENKLFAGARQKNQLLGYYRTAIKAHPHKRVIAVYLAPAGMGDGERQAVCASPEFQARCDRDVCRLVSWGDLDEFVTSGTSRTPFVSSGFKEICDAIRDAQKSKYPQEGDRLRLSTLINRITDLLRSRFPKSRLGCWRAGEYQNVYLQKAKLTVYMVIRFSIQNTPPYQPKVFLPDGRVQLRLETAFQLNRMGRRDPELARWWRRLCAAGEGHVYEGHSLIGKWFKREVRFLGSETDVTAQLVSECEVVLKQLDRGDAIVSAGSNEVEE